MKITEFNKEVFGPLRKDLEAAIDVVSKKYGILIKTGHINYSTETCTVRLECSIIDETGRARTREAETFTMWATLLGMKKEDLNREFQVGNHKYTLAGYAPRKSKFPFIAVRLSDNKRYGLAEKAVKRALGYQTEVKQ